MKRLLLLLPLLAACGREDKDPWTFGAVVERDFTPAHNVHHPGHWEDGGQTCGNEYGYDYDALSGEYEYGSHRVCRDNPDTYVSAWDEWIEDRWRIQVSEDSDGNDDDAETHWVTVGQSLYDQCQVGRTYDRLNKDCDLR